MEFVLKGFVDELHFLEKAGDNTSAFSFDKVAKPISWMGRKELQTERSKLRSNYYKSNDPSVVGRGSLFGGAAGAVPITTALMLSKNPAVRARIKRLAVPVVAVSSLIGAVTAPSRSRKSTARDLVRVERRLKQTSMRSLESQMRKQSASRAGHWRDLPDHWNGKDKSGSPVKGRTWVKETDLGEADSKEAPLPIPQLFSKEGQYTAYITPTPSGAIVFGIHDDVDEEFAELVISKGKNWASSDEVHAFMSKYEKVGKFSIYSLGGS